MEDRSPLVPAHNSRLLCNRVRGLRPPWCRSLRDHPPVCKHPAQTGPLGGSRRSGASNLHSFRSPHRVASNTPSLSRLGYFAQRAQRAGIKFPVGILKAENKLMGCLFCAHCTPAAGHPMRVTSPFNTHRGAPKV